MRPYWMMVKDPSYDPFKGAYEKQLRERYGDAWAKATEHDCRAPIHMLITGYRDRLIKQRRINPSVAER